MRKRIIVLAAALLLCSCGAGEKNDSVDSQKETTTTTVQTSAQTAATTSAAAITTAAAVSETSSDDSSSEPASPFNSVDRLTEEAYSEKGVLGSAEELGLTDTDGGGTNYAFTYKDEAFTAVYTPDNWKIIDSYRVTSYDDMTVICSALKELHPVHGKDMQSYREPEDMAYEWLQHNIAYYTFSDSNPYKANAKDVDIDPADQGLSIMEICIEHIKRL
ncbi:MAG: hypothetical protein IKO27_01515 [Ruminococcus sp.]|nr:hypothetical protein [Ruminococcus sp.]